MSLYQGFCSELEQSSQVDFSDLYLRMPQFPLVNLRSFSDNDQSHIQPMAKGLLDLDLERPEDHATGSGGG